MASFNRVILMGNVTKDPEIRFTGSGTAVLGLSLAMNRVWYENDQKKESCTFAEVTIWGKQAENTHKYVLKGHPLFVEGRLEQDTWEDKETGKKRSKLHVVAERVQFISQKGSQDNNPQTPQNASQTPQNADMGNPAMNPQSPFPNPPPSEDDIKF